MARHASSARRWGIALLVTATAITSTPVASASAGAGGRGEVSSDRPNILVIMTDDQRRFDSLGVMDATRHWFGDEGTTFSNAFATTPLCCPSRASFFTGRYAHNHGIQDNTSAALLDQNSTFQHRLHGAGYRTGLFGKFLNLWPVDTPPPNFDRWAITPIVTYGGADWNVDGEVQTIPTYPTTFVRDETLGFLDEAEANDAQPWFLEAAVMAPHPPQTPEPQYAHAHVPRFRPDPSVLEQDVSDKPPYIQTLDRPSPNRINHIHNDQLRTLLSVDDLVDSVMQRLQDLGEADNTLAIFTSDNGYMWGEHGDLGKSDPYLPSVRVPLLLRWPGHIAPGAKDGRLVALLDLAPTILRAAGMVPGDLDGRSLLAMNWARSELLLEYWQLPDHPTPTWAAIETQRFQFVEYYDAAGQVTFREYYDLRKDPSQLENLLGNASTSDDPDVPALSVRLAAMRTCFGTTCPR